MKADVIIIGSGPAGVSAAFPLLEQGLRVLMLDGGRAPTVAPPRRPFLEARFQDDEQWKWLIGQNFHALTASAKVSPKMRVPTHAHVFEDFLAQTGVVSRDFFSAGSLAPGGLSNAWGTGVARLSAEEMRSFPIDPDSLMQSYATVARRVGISGSPDDLSDYFGLDEWSQPALPVDAMHDRLRQRYGAKRRYLGEQGFRLGQFRMAALSQDQQGRSKCDLSGNCLYGCAKGALYSARFDLENLKRFPNFSYEHLVVSDIQPTLDGWAVMGAGFPRGQHASHDASRVILAMGTLATSQMAMRLLGLESALPLLSCPTAAFMLWMPAFWGRGKQGGFAHSQLAFVQKLASGVNALGSTFSTSSLLLSEFISHLPLSRTHAIDLLRVLLPSCLVGNVFLPSSFSANQLILRNGHLHITGAYIDGTAAQMEQVRRKLRRAFAAMGAYMLPMSFTQAGPGTDIHYAGSLPMRLAPEIGQTSPQGELAGAPGIFVVDGAALPVLSEKSHTLTIMANADRIGRWMAVNHCHSMAC